MRVVAVAIDDPDGPLVIAIEGPTEQREELFGDLDAVLGSLSIESE